MLDVGSIVNALNILSAIDYNQKKYYSRHAIKIIQKKLGVTSGSGVWDIDTVGAVYQWQKSSKRLKPLTADGKFGPTSLGILILEMEQQGDLTNAGILRQYPHKNLSGQIETGGSVKPVTCFFHYPAKSLDLRVHPTDPNRWEMKGSFKVEVYLDHAIAEPWRYEYRQYIRGRVFTIDGYFGDAAKKVWQARDGAKQQEANNFFKNPWGLKRFAFEEDGETNRDGSVGRFGYRSRPPLWEDGIMDIYSENQLGWEYRLQDTFGIAGLKARDQGGNFRTGLKIGLELFYRGVIIQDGKELTSAQINSGNWRSHCVDSKEWSYRDEKIVNW